MMTSREKILKAVAENQPVPFPLKEIPNFLVTENVVETFREVAEKIGSRVLRVRALKEVEQFVAEQFTGRNRILSLLQEVRDPASKEITHGIDPHTFENIKVAVIKGHFGVAENSAIWVTEDMMGQRVIPFIAEHLVIVINIADIVGTMHEAYQKIADHDYGYGVFIAGPSKTADIEQSLVLGAHGPRSLTIFLSDQ